jgi:hypothetical protein
VAEPMTIMTPMTSESPQGTAPPRLSSLSEKSPGTDLRPSAI